MLPQYGFRVIYYNIIRGFNNLNTESGGGNGPGDDTVVGRAIVGSAVVGYVSPSIGTAIVGTSEVT